VGDAPVAKPVVIIVAEPDTISLYNRGDRRGRPDNHLQFSGNGFLDISPFEISGTPDLFDIEAVIPPEVKEFDLAFTIFGDNLAKDEVKTHFKVN
jgi:hypothetical protein